MARCATGTLQICIDAPAYRITSTGSATSLYRHFLRDTYCFLGAVYLVLCVCWRGRTEFRVRVSGVSNFNALLYYETQVLDLAVTDGVNLLNTCRRRLENLYAWCVLKSPEVCRQTIPDRARWSGLTQRGPKCMLRYCLLWRSPRPRSSSNMWLVCIWPPHWDDGPTLDSVFPGLC